MSVFDDLRDFISVADAVYYDAVPVGFDLLPIAAGAPLAMTVDDVGFHAMAYRNPAGAIVIAFEGSSDRDPTYAAASADADAALARGIEPVALRYADAFYKAVRALFPDTAIYVTGRALGGVEAQYVARNNADVAGGMSFGAPGLPGYDGTGAQSNADNFYNIAANADLVGRYSSDPGSLFPTALTGQHYGTSYLAGTGSPVDIPPDWQGLVPYFDSPTNSPEYYIGYDGLLPMAKLVERTSAFSVPTGGRTNITNDFLTVADVYVRTGAESDPASIIYQASMPEHGLLLVDGLISSTFTQADVDNGLVSYSHDGGDATSDTLTLTVVDSFGQSAVIDFGIAILAGSGPAVAINTGLSVAVGGVISLAHHLASVQYDTRPADLEYFVDQAPAHGEIFKDGVQTWLFTQADIDNNRIEYRENGDAATSDSFTFQANDVHGGLTDVNTVEISIGGTTSTTTPSTPWATMEVLDGVVQQGVSVSGEEIQSIVQQFVAGRTSIASNNADGHLLLFNRTEYDPATESALVSGVHSASFGFADGHDITLVGTATELPRLFH